MATVVDIFPKPAKRDKYGVLRVGNSRVSLDGVVRMFNAGADVSEIQYAFDTLTLAEVHGAISFYLHNKALVDAYLVEQEKQEDGVRERIERMFPSDEIAKKIKARKNGEDPSLK